MVLHDLNHASRFSHFMMAMRDGNLMVNGSPKEVMTKKIYKGYLISMQKWLYVPIVKIQSAYLISCTI